MDDLFLLHPYHDVKTNLIRYLSYCTLVNSTLCTPLESYSAKSHKLFEFYVFVYLKEEFSFKFRSSFFQAI